MRHPGDQTLVPESSQLIAHPARRVRHVEQLHREALQADRADTPRDHPGGTVGRDLLPRSTAGSRSHSPRPTTHPAPAATAPSAPSDRPTRCRTSPRHAYDRERTWHKIQTPSDQCRREFHDDQHLERNRLIRRALTCRAGTYLPAFGECSPQRRTTSAESFVDGVKSVAARLVGRHIHLKRSRRSSGRPLR